MRILVLPCGHALCRSCHAACSHGSSGRCPMDEEQFEEAECSGYLPTTNANNLKVRCWNEDYGCQFSGPVEDMLPHYEKECTFHVVECLRCGEGVLHGDLCKHYVAGCGEGVSSTRIFKTSSESRAVTLQDVSAALEEVKTLLGDSSNDNMLPELQSKVNELAEQIKKQGYALAELTHKVGESVMSQVAQVATKLSSAISQLEPTSRRDPTEKDTPSEAENFLMHGDLKNFADFSRGVLLDMRRTTSQYFPAALHYSLWSRES
ncbi:hypothetical protein MTO96_012272 [Rhipicephalus appendiculatus]